MFGNFREGGRWVWWEKLVEKYRSSGFIGQSGYENG